MIYFIIATNLLAAMIMSTSNPENGDGRGVIFGIMIIIVMAIVVVCESGRRMKGGVNA